MFPQTCGESRLGVDKQTNADYFTHWFLALDRKCNQEMRGVGVYVRPCMRANVVCACAYVCVPQKAQGVPLHLAANRALPPVSAMWWCHYQSSGDPIEAVERLIKNMKQCAAQKSYCVPDIALKSVQIKLRFGDSFCSVRNSLNDICNHNVESLVCVCGAVVDWQRLDLSYEAELQHESA